MKRTKRNGREYEYLQIVESYRDGGRVKQRLIASLGRRDLLVADGSLDGLLQSLSRFSDKVKVVERVREAWTPRP